MGWINQSPFLYRGLRDVTHDAAILKRHIDGMPYKLAEMPRGGIMQKPRAWWLWMCGVEYTYVVADDVGDEVVRRGSPAKNPSPEVETRLLDDFGCRTYEEFGRKVWGIDVTTTKTRVVKGVRQVPKGSR